MKIVLFEDNLRTAGRITSAVKKLLKKSDVVVHFQPSEDAVITKIALYEDRLVAEAKKPVYKGATLWVTDRDLSQTTDYRGLSEVIVSKVANRLGVPICKYAQGTTNSVFERQRDWGDAQIIIDRSDIPQMARRIVMLAQGYRSNIKRPQAATRREKAASPRRGDGYHPRTTGSRGPYCALCIGRSENGERNFAVCRSAGQKNAGEPIAEPVRIFGCSILSFAFPG